MYRGLRSEDRGGAARVDDRGRPLALGVMLTESTPRIEKSLDRSSRAAWLAQQLTAQAQGCRLIVGEAMAMARAGDGLAHIETLIREARCGLCGEPVESADEAFQALGAIRR